MFAVSSVIFGDGGNEQVDFAFEVFFVKRSRVVVFFAPENYVLFAESFRSHITRIFISKTPF